MKRIFLVRHGESQANVTPALYQVVGDHKIETYRQGEGTSQGVRQVSEAIFLASKQAERLLSPKTIDSSTCLDQALHPSPTDGAGDHRRI